MRRKHGFTLIELLVVIAIIALLVSILLPSLARVRELAKQTVCGTSVKGIGTSLAMYAADNRDVYPALIENAEDGEWSSSWNDAPDGDFPTEDFDEWREENAGCNIQHYWLLVHQGICGEKQFSCPSDDRWRKPEHDEEEQLGFQAWANVSFGFQPATHHSDNAGYPNRAGQDGAMVIVGDRLTNDADAAVPDDEEYAKTHRTSNHPNDGGNYLSMNASVSFEDSHMHDFGWKENNVYTQDVDDDGELTHDAGEPGGDYQEMPIHLNDTVLLSEDDD